MIKSPQGYLWAVSSEPNPGPENAANGPKAVLQEAIDATAVAYAGDSRLDVEQSLRTELASRGIEQVDDAWVSDTVEKIRQGHEVVVGEHDGSVDEGQELGG
jgi:hypothetical protein